MNNTTNILHIEGLTLIETIPIVDIPIYIFQDYKKEKNNPIAKQLIQYLTNKGISSCERFIWTDIRNILFCQAFLYKEGMTWAINGKQMTSRDKMTKRWRLLRGANILEYFKFQWKFLERLQFGYMDDTRKQEIKKKYFQERLWKQFRRGKYDEIDHLAKVNSNTLLADSSGVMKHTQIYLVPQKEVFETDYLLFGNIEWQPKKHLQFYLNLLQCIDNQSILNLMQDLLEDFNQSPQGYQTLFWQLGMPDILAYNKSSCSYILLKCKGSTTPFKKEQIRWFKRNADLYKFNAAVVLASEKQIKKLKDDFACTVDL